MKLTIEGGDDSTHADPAEISTRNEHNPWTPWEPPNERPKLTSIPTPAAIRHQFGDHKVTEEDDVPDAIRMSNTATWVNQLTYPTHQTHNDSPTSNLP